MYYPENSYKWEYGGQEYDTWFEIERLYGEAATHAGGGMQKIIIQPDWRPNKPFRAVMKLTNMSRGRSAANFKMEDEQGKTYTMFMKDLMDLLQRYSMSKGYTECLEWCFCKRGQNYGLTLAR